MQNDFASLMQTLAPDLAAEISQRALVLERIASMAPVGRRQLAAKLHLTEREIRACADKLREQGFISLDPAGMTLTDKAREILPGIQAFTRAMNDLSGLEEELAKALNADRVCIVSGDADQDENLIDEVGRTAAHRVRGMLHSGSTLAVAGGSTMAATARAMHSPPTARDGRSGPRRLGQTCPHPGKHPCGGDRRAAGRTSPADPPARLHG